MAVSLVLYPNTRQRFAGRMNADLAAIEHLDAHNIEMLARTSADNLRKGGDADAHEFTACPLFCLFAAQSFVAYILHCQPQRTFIVATIVGPVQSGAIWEGFRLNKVLQAQVCRVFSQIVG